MGKPSKKSGKPEVDPRFASALYDPRFIVPSLKKNKVKVDERFSKEELKKLNVTATGRKVKVDRYGRKVKKGANDDYEKYFEEEKKENPHSSSKEESGSEADSESGSDSEEEKEIPKAERKKLVKQEKSSKSDPGSELENAETESESESNSETGTEFIDRARGEGLQSESSSESESDESEESESEIEAEEEKPEEGDPSATFAVVNLDWDNVRAVDLMATFASFVPKGGSIKSVKIYPSEFGKEQMQKEEIEGPPKELFKSKKKKVELDSDSDEELDLNNKEDLERAARKLYEEDDGEEDYDSKALRRYQLQRLRYYYAVVECDSIATSKNIYDNCDGSEYESTANIFDLRYVPGGMEFDESDVKDVCTKIPSSYRPDSTFVTDALQHSKVKLTWDETPKERLTLSTRLFSQKEIDDMDFKAYLASDSDDSEGEQNEQLKDKYKNLLGGKFSFDKGDEEDEGDVDMEITFNPGLDENKPAPEPKAEEEESTIAAYKRKEKERRARRLEKFKSQQLVEEQQKSEEKGKSKKTKKNKKQHRDNDGDEKSKAELELLLLDENNDNDKPDHFSMRDIVKAEKRKGKKKGKKNYSDDLVQDNFTADLNDPRFKDVFENHEYAIDPTSSEFKKTETMKEILQERSKRLKKEKGGDRKKSKKAHSGEDGSALNSLVERLKRKSKH